MKSMPWVKLHTDILNDPKLMRAMDRGVKGLGLLPWLIAFARHADDGGRLTVMGEAADIADLARGIPDTSLRRPALIRSVLEALQSLGVLVAEDSGVLRFDAWERRGNARTARDHPAAVRERVAQHRQRKGNADVTQVLDDSNANTPLLEGEGKEGDEKDTQSETKKSAKKPPAVSPSLDSTDPLNGDPAPDTIRDGIVDYATLPPSTEPPHLPSEVDVAPFLAAFYAKDTDHRRQVAVVYQLRQALAPSGCRIAKGQTLRTTADVMQRGLDQIVRDRATIRVPDRAIVVLLKMLYEGRVNLSLNAHGETPTEAASAREKASAAEDDAIHQARRDRAAAWAKRNPEALTHITHRIDLRYGGRPVDGFKRSVYEQEILAACLKASEHGATPTPSEVTA